MENELITLTGMMYGTCFALAILIAGRAITVCAASIAEIIADRENKA